MAGESESEDELGRAAAGEIPEMTKTTINVP
jgi:hypothetical protein